MVQGTGTCIAAGFTYKYVYCIIYEGGGLRPPLQLAARDIRVIKDDTIQLATKAAK